MKKNRPAKKKRAPRIDKRAKTSMALPPELMARVRVRAALETQTGPAKRHMRDVVIDAVEAYLGTTGTPHTN